MVSQQLIEQWRVRLAVWQQRLDEDRPRPWLARAYVRVLKFLLAQYSAGGDETHRMTTRVRESVADTDAPRDRSAMRFEAVSPELMGKPPRNRQDIRSVLEAVKAKVPHVEQGPLADGLQPDDPIVVAAFYRRGFAVGLREELEAKGIESRAKRFRRQTQVIVRAGDLESAKHIVASHARFVHDSARWRVPYTPYVASLGAVLGILLGFAIAGLSVGGSDFVPAAFLFGILFCFLLYLVGFIVGIVLDG